MKRLFAAFAVALALAAVPSRAQGVSSEREVELVRTTFAVGNYREALRRGRDAMASRNYTDVQRIDLNKYVGMAAFFLGDIASATEHLFNLLEQNPDYVLDPFEFPPTAVQFFEDLRKKNADALNLVRQKIALRDEQARRETADRERARAATEEQRRRLEQMAAQVTVKTVEKRNFALNLAPFGAGQFQQGRTGVGVMLASAQGVLAATSLIGFLAIESMKETRTSELTGVYGKVTHTDTGIPASREAELNTWRWVKYGSGAAFYAVWAAGVFDAIYHHEDEVVTTSIAQVPVPAPRPTEPKPVAPAPDRRGDAAPVPTPRPFLFPTSGGLGAGVTLHF